MTMTERPAILSETIKRCAKSNASVIGSEATLLLKKPPKLSRFCNCEIFNSLIALLAEEVVSLVVDFTLFTALTVDVVFERVLLSLAKAATGFVALLRHTIDLQSMLDGYVLAVCWL